MVSIGRSAMERTTRSSVSLLTYIPSRAARRAPARPAMASPIAPIIVSSTVVHRAQHWVSPGTCSANAVALQVSSSQTNLRTTSSRMTGRAPIAVSAGRRRYRGCTLLDAVPHVGHRPSWMGRDADRGIDQVKGVDDDVLQVR